MKTYTSKNTIEALQITEELFHDVALANEAQKLPLNEVHYTVNGRFCTLNCINKTLNYQGITLNLGDYLIKSGNSLEPCSKDKFEDEFAYLANNTNCVEHQSELEETIEKVEEMVKENPETANFVGKVGDIVKSFFYKPQENTTPQYSEEYVKCLEEEVKELRKLLDKYIEYAYTKIQPLDPEQSANMTIYDIADYQLNQLNEPITGDTGNTDEAIKQRDEEIKDCHSALDKIITLLYGRFNLPEDFYAGKQLQETVDMLLTQLASDFAEHEQMKAKLNSYADTCENTDCAEPQELKDPDCSGPTSDFETPETTDEIKD